MPERECGVYRVTCVPTGKCYIGSSHRIRIRWTQHKSRLRRSIHVSPHFQRAWNKHGEEAFSFEIIEKCPREVLIEREQYWVDHLKPALNTKRIVNRPNAEHIAKVVALNRARMAAITHCPRGHPYDAANTYRNKKGKRICRACNALRVAAIYAAETPEQTAKRLQHNMQCHNLNRAERTAKQREYAAAHKEEKREYDRLRRERLKADRRQCGQQLVFI